MTKEQDLNQKNREQAIKLQGQIDAEIARLNAELKKDSIKSDHKRAEEIKQAKHALEILKQNIKHAQAASKASKDLLEEKKLPKEKLLKIIISVRGKWQKYGAH